MGSVENEQAAGSAAPPPGFNRYASASTCTSVTSVTHSDTLTQVKERLQKLPNRLSTETFPEEEKKNHVDTRYSASSSGSQCSRDPPMPTTSSTTTELLLQGVPPAAGSLGPQSGARRKETDTMEETWNENEGGLSWGEQRARDGSWEARWLQQRITRRNENSDANREVLFGRSSGINRALNQRWTTSWETTTDPEIAKKEKPNATKRHKIVMKQVLQYDSAMKTKLEDWNERVEEQEESNSSEPDAFALRHVYTTKSGCDERTGRTWKSACEEYPNNNDSEEKQDVIPFKKKEQFEEVLDNTTRKRVSVADDGKTVVTETLTTVDPETSKVSFTEGHTTESLANGNVYKKRWETREDINSEGQGTKKVTIKEECTTEPSGNTWGTKIVTTELFPVAVQRPLEQDADEELVKLPVVVETIRERWYDNTLEKVVDRWTSKHEFSENDPRQLIFREEYGKKDGDRYSDGTSWGELWERRWEKTDESVGTTTALGTDDTAVQRVDAPLNGNVDNHLTLCRELNDRWWKEPSGNSWGEKRSLENGTEHHERWYRNGDEEQFDRWDVPRTGKRKGTKEGRKLNGSCEWHETWEADDCPTPRSVGDFWIDKHWRKQEHDGRVVVWGENSGRAQQRVWREKWNKDENCPTGQQRIEKYHDDGCGNFETRKEGSDWINGAVTNWFVDRHGECLGQNEKWSVKEGRNEHGDVWKERWNEFPDRKSAEKTGENSSGDVWREAWNEEISEIGKTKTWAEKTGKNNRGEEWSETWFEQGGEKKAKKQAKNTAEEWEEAWGEVLREDGSGEKWTSKWARDRATGNAKGRSWGDRWTSEGGHHWGDIWENDSVDKWWRDTTGRPDGC